MEEWKKYGYMRVTADSLICPEPCFLVSVCLVANATGASTAVIRDGHNTGGEAVIDLAALTSSKDNRSYNPPLFFKKGLYVDVGSNVTSVLVQYLPYHKEE